ncbi:COX15/CtaA family protein [Gordonia humi]|uniref:COX15/CtaA family protein n=1 Tax=Gordonia humi TaxID=686429 RepID=UPI003618B889
MTDAATRPSVLGSWAGFKNPTQRFLYGWAVADLAVNILLVVTGGAVRVTDSGLGCPTWPQCTSGSLTPHAAMGVHGVIEFGNRMLTWVLVIVAIAAFVAAWRRRPVDRLSRRLTLGIGLGVPPAGRGGRRHRAHESEPVGRLVPLPGDDADHLAGLVAGGPHTSGSADGHPGTGSRAHLANRRRGGVGGVRRHLGHRVSRHRGHRLRSARR